MKIRKYKGKSIYLPTVTIPLVRKIININIELGISEFPNLPVIRQMNDQFDLIWMWTSHIDDKWMEGLLSKNVISYNKTDIIAQEFSEL